MLVGAVAEFAREFRPCLVICLEALVSKGVW